MTAALEGGEWSAARPGRTLHPVKTPVPILQEAGWAPGSVWTGGKFRPHRDWIPDRPARSQSLSRLSYRAHILLYVGVQIEVFREFHSLISDNYRPRYCLRLIGRYVDSLYVQRRRIFFFCNYYRVCKTYGKIILGAEV